MDYIFHCSEKNIVILKLNVNFVWCTAWLVITILYGYAMSALFIAVSHQRS